ncbi:MAG: hypothetical protein AAF581_15930, partial [Planctomycetota bacterium]
MEVFYYAAFGFICGLFGWWAGGRLDRKLAEQHGRDLEANQIRSDALIRSLQEDLDALRESQSGDEERLAAAEEEQAAARKQNKKLQGAVQNWLSRLNGICVHYCMLGVADGAAQCSSLCMQGCVGSCTCRCC